MNIRNTYTTQYTEKPETNNYIYLTRVTPETGETDGYQDMSVSNSNKTMNYRIHQKPTKVKLNYLLKDIKKY